MIRKFKTGANRDDDNYKIDYEGHLSPIVLEIFGEYMHKHRQLPNGVMRDADNWQKGFGTSVVAKSLIRHTIEFWKAHRGYNVHDRRTGNMVSIEDTLCAIIFNAQAYLLEIHKSKRSRSSFRKPR